MPKYAIVTGASPSSIGFLAAKKLVSPSYGGYNVILACRDQRKGEEAEKLIRSSFTSTEGGGGDVRYLHLDLASFDSIHRFVKDVHALDDGAILDPDKPESSLCLLVNNAGVGFGLKDLTPYNETSDGLEEIIGVNHFGTFLLTQLLLDDLKRCGGGRIVIVSSALHKMGNKKPAVGSDDEKEKDEELLLLPNFPDGIFQSKDDYDGKFAYRVSKLCNLWFAYELQRRLLLNEESSNADNNNNNNNNIVRVNAISPGFIPTTGLTRRSGTAGCIFLKYVLDPFRYLGIGITRSPDDGAETIVQACGCGLDLDTSSSSSSSDSKNNDYDATAKAALEAINKGGNYFSLPKGKNTIIAPIPSSNESMDEVKAKRLWNLSMKTCKLTL